MVNIINTFKIIFYLLRGIIIFNTFDEEIIDSFDNNKFFEIKYKLIKVFNSKEL